MLAGEVVCQTASARKYAYVVGACMKAMQESQVYVNGGRDSSGCAVIDKTVPEVA